MLYKKICLLAFFFLSISSAFSTTSPAFFEFALPELEGSISLGIYNRSGTLMRTLAQHVPISSFQIGDNGLIASWNGITNEGLEASAGDYEVRGFVVGGNIKVDGIKFHFNDWIQGKQGPFPTAILSMACAPKGGFVVLLTALGGKQQIAYYANFQSLKWIKNIDHPCPAFNSLNSPHIPFFTGFEKKEIFLVRGNHLIFFSLEDGSITQPSIPLPFFPIVACRKGDKFPLFAEGKMLGIPTSKIEWPFSSPSHEIIDIAPTSQGFLALSREGFVQEWNNGSWHRVPLPVLAKKIAQGYADTIWLIADSFNKEEFLGQFNIRGEFLRKVQLSSEEGVTSCLAAPLDENKVFLLRSKSDGSSYFSGYRFIKDAKTTVCHEFLRHVLIPNSQFTFSENKLIPHHPSTTPLPGLEVQLAKDILNSNPGTIQIQAKIEGNTAWLTTEHGLPLLPVGKLQNASRALIVRNPHQQPAEDTVALYCGNGSVVAEFSIQNIGSIHPIHSGLLRWK